jgi:hypothetical protein
MVPRYLSERVRIIMLRRNTAQPVNPTAPLTAPGYQSGTYTDIADAQEQHAWLCKHSDIPCHLIAVPGGYRIVAERNPYPRTYNRLVLTFTAHVTAFQFRDSAGSRAHFVCRACAEAIEDRRNAGKDDMRTAQYDFLAACWEPVLGWDLGSKHPSATCAVCYRPLTTTR